MEPYLKLLESANLDFKNADHMVFVTYPLVNDPKLIMAIAEKLYNSIMSAITSVLTYDYNYKRVEILPEQDREKVDLFKVDTIKRYNFSREILVVIEELKDLLEFRKKSPVEFVRKENFVVCSSRYNTKTINLQKIKYYVHSIRLFMERMNRILKNGI